MYKTLKDTRNDNLSKYLKFERKIFYNKLYLFLYLTIQTFISELVNLIT
ncbi:MAG: hypothetical protein Q8807_03515 ['Waltheria sp.' little leaf phytoplasma]|nr:hypothetical protein ['Waltheria sp.' little leaf phytoplasma]